MRVSEKTKLQTRERILRRARKILSKNNFHAMTTRDIATAAGIAAGTFFNYFPTKEALLLTLVVEALDLAQADFESRRDSTSSLNEELFLLIMAGLTQLAPHRGYVGAALERLLNPLSGSDSQSLAGQIRARQLELFADIMHRRGAQTEASSPVTLHLCWTLYLGVLSFWTRDESPNQEDTQALLDRSLGMLVGSMEPGTENEEASNDAEC
jgi:AcrR family transcriptional regulator